MSKIVLIYSGGLDSTVLLLKLLAEGHNVHALSINYGQRHARELEAATNITAMLNVPHKKVDLTNMRDLLAGSSQTDDNVPVPHGHYAEENMKKTVVPNRNMVLLSVAGAWAISLKADSVAYAAHAGDHAIYPDCREEFVGPLSEALRNADWHQVEIIRPFLDHSKTDVVREGNRLNYKLPASAAMAQSYSCYEGGALHCGLCGTCQERRVAFRDAKVPDPTQYNPEGLKELPDNLLQS